MNCFILKNWEEREISRFQGFMKFRSSLFLLRIFIFIYIYTSIYSSWKSCEIKQTEQEDNPPQIQNNQIFIMPNVWIGDNSPARKISGSRNPAFHHPGGFPLGLGCAILHSSWSSMRLTTAPCNYRMVKLSFADWIIPGFAKWPEVFLQGFKTPNSFQVKSVWYIYIYVWLVKLYRPVSNLTPKR